MDKQVMKVLIKVKNREERRYQWIHFCYLPSALYTRYFTDLGGTFDSLKQRIIQWAQEDFDVVVKLNTKEQVAAFKQFILNSYKYEYKNLFPKDGISFSKAGWFTLWLTKHIEIELEETNV